jgi:hypothetical protein
MKRMFFAAILLVAISTASFTKEVVAEGKTHSSLGDFRVESAVNPVTINGEELKTFVITYQNSTLKVQVAIRDEGKCRKYFVLSDKLSVQYVCNANYFGVEKLDKALEKEGLTTSDESLNRTEYYHQKVLAAGQGRIIDNTMLIAAYFPRLLNDSEEMVATR